MRYTQINYNNIIAYEFELCIFRELVINIIYSTRVNVSIHSIAPFNK